MISILILKHNIVKYEIVILKDIKNEKYDFLINTDIEKYQHCKIGKFEGYQH